MRNTDKFSTILLVAMSLISAQGVEAQRATPNTNQNNPHYNSGKSDRYGRSEVLERYDRSYGHGSHGRDELRIDPRKHGYVHRGFDQRVGHHFHNGYYYKFHHGRWARMNAPVGMRVQFMPYGTEVIYTRHGVLYRFGTVYFQQVNRGGGFIVVNGPRHRKVW